MSEKEKVRQKKKLVPLCFGCEYGSGPAIEFRKIRRNGKIEMREIRSCLLHQIEIGLDSAICPDGTNKVLNLWPDRYSPAPPKEGMTKQSTPQGRRTGWEDY